jgi:biopolymer transport protein ExbB
MTGTVAFIVKGGPLVAVIVILSVVSISVFIERYWVMRVAAGRMRFSLYFDKIKELIRKGDIDGVEDLARQQRGVYGRVIQILVDKYKLLSGKVDWSAMKDNLNESMHEELAIESSLLDRNLIVMATIGSIANLIGLLGTVEGMIRSFAALSMVGAAASIASQQLAIGIAEALVNAAGGLIVAISAVIFHAYFMSKIDLFSFNIEGVSKEFITGVVTAYR